MRISIEGPPLSDFNPQKALDIFFTSERRPNVVPYSTPRPSKRAHDNPESDLEANESDLEANAFSPPKSPKVTIIDSDTDSDMEL